MKMCEYCRKKPAKIKFCSKKCGNAACGKRHRTNRCTRCGKTPRATGSTRCKNCKPVNTFIRCGTCNRFLVRKSPGHRFCKTCSDKKKLEHKRNRDRERKLFVAPCPRCGWHVNGGTLPDHTAQCDISTEDARDWYNARKKVDEIMARNEWNLGDKTIDQLDREYFAWKSS